MSYPNDAFSKLMNGIDRMITVHAVEMNDTDLGLSLKSLTYGVRWIMVPHTAAQANPMTDSVTKLPSSDTLGMTIPLYKCPKKPPNTVPENMNVVYRVLLVFGTILPANVPPHEPVGPNAHLNIKSGDEQRII